MQLGIMVTNGGPHPPEKWAVTTAEQIFPISNDIEASRSIEAKRIQLAIVEALAPHHRGVQTREQVKLTTLGQARYKEPHDPENVVDEALAAVVAAIKGSPWESKTQDPAWIQAVGNILCTHFATSMDIERQWHAHRNPSEGGKAYLAAKVGG